MIIFLHVFSVPDVQHVVDHSRVVVYLLCLMWRNSYTLLKITIYYLYYTVCLESDSTVMYTPSTHLIKFIRLYFIVFSFM